MGIDWNKVKNNAKAKDDQQYAAMKADTEKRGKTVLLDLAAVASTPAAVTILETVLKTVKGA